MAFLTAVVRIAILVVIVYFIQKLGVTAYGYGYRVFSEEPMTTGSGTDVSVTIPLGSSAMDIGKILEERGLIRDAKLFYIQEKLSAYRGKLKPGTYTLNTSMTAEDMMGVISQEDQEDTASEETTSEGTASVVPESEATGSEAGVTDAAQ